jgi:chromosome segregation ATPase
MANLETRLGELSGELRALVPALERVEERVNQGQQEIASIRTEITNIKEEITAIKLQLNEDEKNEKEDIKGHKNHLWDFLKLVAAAIIGAILTYVIERASK